MKPVVIGTYNMSFASDYGLDPEVITYPSEATFLLKNKMEQQQQQQQQMKNVIDLRLYWKNTLSNLKNFIIEHKPVFVGLQEMNTTLSPNAANDSVFKASQDKYGEKYGITEVKNMISDLNQNQNQNYIVESQELYTEKQRNSSIVSIIDTNILGKIIISNHYNLATVDNARPILFTYTDKGYLLINVNSANDPKDSANGYIIGKQSIQSKLDLFLKANKIVDLNPNKVLMVGDFNDRYNGIGKLGDSKGGEIILRYNNQNELNLKYIDVAPNSCCFNWDSSCSETRQINPVINDISEISVNKKINLIENQSIDKQNIFKRNGIERKTCRVPTYNEIDPNITITDPNLTNTQIKLAGPGKRFLMPSTESSINNYQYTGDYCLAVNPSTKMEIFRDSIAKQSSESDHELVYVTVNIPNETEMTFSFGGKRSRKNKFKSTNKTKKSRKSSKNSKKIQKYRKTTNRNKSHY